MKSSNYVITKTDELPVNSKKVVEMSLLNVQIDTHFQPFRVSDKTLKILFEAYAKAIKKIPEEDMKFGSRVAFAINGKTAMPVILSSYYRVKKSFEECKIELSESPCVSDDMHIICLYVLKGMRKEYLSVPYETLEGSVSLMSGISWGVMDGKVWGERKWLEIEL